MRSTPPNGSMFWDTPVWKCSAALIVCATLSLVSGCHESSGRVQQARPARGLPLQAKGIVDLGVVSSGAEVSQLVKVVNTSAVLRELATIKTSCPCVKVKPLARFLARVDAGT